MLNLNYLGNPKGADSWEEGREANIMSCKLCHGFMIQIPATLFSTHSSLLLRVSIQYVRRSARTPPIHHNQVAVGCWLSKWSQHSAPLTCVWDNGAGGDREDSTNPTELIHLSYTWGGQVPFPGAAKHKLPPQAHAPRCNLWGKSEERWFCLLVWM